MTLQKFTMEFQPRTIEHLGLKLYSTLPPVISELVSNAYDSESPKVEILLPQGEITASSEVIVRDSGHAMTGNELQNEYLPIGRNRRGDDSTNGKSKNGKRTVTGRKGLGKLSAFGVAEEMEIRSVAKGSAITLRLNYPQMQKWAREHPREPYEPEIIASRSGATNDKDGVEITLRKLHRRYKINGEVVRRALARRLSVIGKNFKVDVNGEEIKPGDRICKTDCEPNARWEVAELPGAGALASGLQVSGWMGFLPTSSQSNRGIDIFANGKAAELESYFNYPSTHAQFARAHLTGEIHADFLDSQTSDLVATPRNSVLWEDPDAHVLQEWGQKSLKWAFDQWLDLRRKKKIDEITRVAAFDVWLAGRQPHEQRVATKLLKLLADDEGMDPESARPMLEIIKGSVEASAFIELVEAMEESQSVSAAKLLTLFNEWRVIEARDMLKHADGRLAAIERLEHFMEVGALEVREMQPLLRDNIWLVNPRWNEPQVEQHYSKLLRDNCLEARDLDEKDRRLDILGVSEGKRLTVVEIKHPHKVLERKDLEQIERYVDWADANIVGTGPDSFTDVNGLLIVGSIGNKADLKKKITRMAGDDIRVETYMDVHAASKKFYASVDKRLKSVAPEYGRQARRKAKEAAGRG